MSGRDLIPGVRGVVFVNLQKRYVVRTSSLVSFVRDLKKSLHLEKREFNVCFVDDSSIRQLNLAYRGKDRATDVLSFSWHEAGGAHMPGPPYAREDRGFTNFLGDIVISVETARRNAEIERHTTLNEIRWLILHGVLHLLGYDHEKDAGQMFALELALREQLGMAGGPGEKGKSKVKTPKAKSKAEFV
jgi:probable rRNA maturation factor